MTPIIHRRIDLPSAWRGADLGSKDAYCVDLESRHLRALDDALARVRRRGLGLHEISKRDFGLRSIEADVARWYAEVQEGRGLVLLRGFPIDRYSPPYGIVEAPSPMLRCMMTKSIHRPCLKPTCSRVPTRRKPIFSCKRMEARWAESPMIATN